MKNYGWMVTGLVLVMVCAAQGAEHDLAPLRSRVRAMSHGYHSEADWQAVMQDIEKRGREAAEQGHADTEIEIALLRAMVLSDIRGQHTEAVVSLADLRDRFSPAPPEALRGVYIREADILAKVGDEEGIRKLIADFKASPLYDAPPIQYKGGQGRVAPLALTRPNARGADSITVTAMRKSLKQARLAPGRPAPAFDVIDANGKRWNNEQFKGHVLLLDFWQSHWAPWQRDIPLLSRTWHAYHPQGFDVLGMCLGGECADGLRLLAHHDANWPQLPTNRNMLADYGIFGDATTILIGKDGRIIGHNLRGAERTPAVRRALGLSDESRTIHVPRTGLPK